MGEWELQSPPHPVSNAVSNATEQLVDPEAERKRRDEELLAAAQAAQNAGIAKGPRDGALLGDECVDEPMVLGRPLKGLRQKDIDPTEREAIMAEMFKRVRPFLERNIEKAAERARARVKEEEEENAERAKQEQIRAERLLRRTEGIPVHLLSATASDFRSTAKASSSAPAAPYGGEITDAQMAELELEILRTLRAPASGRAPAPRETETGKTEPEDRHHARFGNDQRKIGADGIENPDVIDRSDRVVVA